jgi:D-amino-acid dehydrogenase
MSAAAAEDVVVIGGGAVGVCCAEALARSGRRVLVLERDRLCAGSSWGNSGLLTTSASAPEAAPGVIGQATRWMLDRDGPFRIRPRPSPQFVAWIRRFRQHCTAAAATSATTYLRDLVRDNTRLVAAQAVASARDFSFRECGVLVLYRTETGLAEGMATARALSELDIPSEVLNPAQVARLEPRVTAQVVGGILYPEDAHLDPSEYVEAIAEQARAGDVRIEEGIEVLRLHGAHRVELIETNRSTIRPELVVVANGAWAGMLMSQLGGRLLLEPGKGFSLTRDVGSVVYERPLRLYEMRTVVSSMARNVRVTSKLDLVGFDTRVRERRITVSASRAERYVSLPAGVSKGTAWAGLRPLAPDGLPFLGRTSAAANVIVATGHGHLGISLAAVTGDAVANIAAGEPAGIDLHPVRPDRFA